LRPCRNQSIGVPARGSGLLSVVVTQSSAWKGGRRQTGPGAREEFELRAPRRMWRNDRRTWSDNGHPATNPTLVSLQPPRRSHGNNHPCHPGWVQSRSRAPAASRSRLSPRTERRGRIRLRKRQSRSVVRRSAAGTEMAACDDWPGLLSHSSRGDNKRRS
jgi:hypothetical protein